jgi:hypothetical protein
MQKFLKLLNFRLDVVVRDVTGLTGMKIIESICNGVLDPNELAKHRHYNCRKSEQEIAKALVSNGREDYLFGLKQELERHFFYQSQIEKCDQEVNRFLSSILKDSNIENPEEKPYKRKNKNSIQGLDLNKAAFQYFSGIDLYQIPGVSHSTILTIMAEIGPKDLKSLQQPNIFHPGYAWHPIIKSAVAKHFPTASPKVVAG